WIVATSDFSGLVSYACALASAAAMVPIVSLERCMAALHAHDIKAHRTGFGSFGSDAMANRFLGVLGHKGLKVRLGILMLEVASRVRRTTPASSAQALDALMSTIRTASIRGRGGSRPNSRGGSPLSTQRQNFFSAVSRRCW